MFDEIFRIITNPEVIAVNQDKLGAQGFKFKLDGDKELWGCPLDDGAVAALFLNRGNETATFKIQWSDLFLENNVVCVMHNYVKIRTAWAIYVLRYYIYCDYYRIVILLLSSDGISSTWMLKCFCIYYS